MFVFSEHYDLDWPGHVFPTEKYRLVAERLLRDRICEESDIVEPEPATDEDLLLVHDPHYLDRLRSLTADPRQAYLVFEAPISELTLNALHMAAGGSILAARRAEATGGMWLNIGGGFHHAFSGHGEGFCFINDVAIAASVLLRDTKAERILIVDCDLHQGNGTARIFEGDDSVFTLSIHQEILYPVPKQRSDIDIGLDAGTGDTVYLDKLAAGLEQAFKTGRFDFLFYLAGADPYSGDQLGSLELTKDGLRRRDSLVFDFAGRFELPVAVTLAGGYAEKTEDIIEIHTSTAGLLAERCRRINLSGE